MKTVLWNVRDYIMCRSLFEICISLSVAFHILMFGAWHVKSAIISPVSSEELNFNSMNVDFDEIPPELLGGYSDPAPVEMQEWIEGTDRKKDPPADKDIKENVVSGTGTDKDGYLFSVKGDRPPRPVFNFDLRKFFPYEARRASITNKIVVVRVQVDDTGKLNSSSVISASAGYGFDEAAIEVLNRARFIPGYKNGVPVKMVHDLAIRFVLD